MIVGGTTPRSPARDGYEEDVLEPAWRRVYCWTKRAGATSKVKRRVRRRERREGRRMVRDVLDGGLR